MARYFLANSPTYKAQTTPEIYRRREVVAEVLKDNYKARRNQDDQLYQRAALKLAGESIELSPASFNADKALLRAAYSYLSAKTEHDKQRVCERVYGGIKFGINCLKKDGISTLSQVGLTEASAEDGVEDEVEEVPAKPTYLQLSELQGAERVAQSVMEMVNSFNEFSAKVAELLDENNLLKQENERLSSDLADTYARTADHGPYVQLLEEENERLTSQIRELRDSLKTAHSSALTALADRYPNVTELFVAAQKIGQSRSRREMDYQVLMGKLPQEFKWGEVTGKIVYRTDFMKALADLQADEQEAVFKQVTMLAVHGPQYPSLRTKRPEIRIPYSEPDCMDSRASQEFRFTWKKNGELVLFWIYKKGDTRINYTET